MPYVQIAVNLPQVNGVFDYHLPEAMIGQVQPGCLVVVPFGKQLVQGVVLRFVDEPSVMNTRPVEGVLDSEPALTAWQLALAAWLSEHSLAPLAVCIDLFLPPGISQQADTLYHRLPAPPPDDTPLTPLQTRILAKLEERGDLRGRQFEVAFPRVRWKESIQALVRRGWVTHAPVLPPPGVRPKLVRTVHLAVPPEQAQDFMEQTTTDARRKLALARRQAMLRLLINEPWPVAVAWTYAVSGGNLNDLTALAEAGLVQFGSSEELRDPLSKLEVDEVNAPVLTEEQTAAWEAIEPQLQAALEGRPTSPILLQGITGSGKTELYLRAAGWMVAHGRQAVILVPEISLTPQTVRRFMGRFPGQVGLVHSRLSAGERFDTWRRARSGLLPVIVGPRSALFTPVPQPGLLVVDECHDDSFYQSEAQPYYHGVEVALQYAKQNGNVVIFGSATPEVNLVYRAGQEGWTHLRLARRVAALLPSETASTGAPERPPLPKVRVVDMRTELKANNRSIFSLALQDALADVLSARQQAILFLNRRGTATYVFCRDCGYIVRCPKCDVPLTWHEDQGALTCHTCNYRRLMPKHCPVCTSPRIRALGIGTEGVEKAVRELFPQAETLRWDAETTRKKGAHELLLSQFTRHQADILIGTQMLAKGLDLPLVTLVGVVLADIGLAMPDYRTGERAFQLLTQVAGRSGRSSLGGQVIFQTFQPEHYAIQAAADHDFDGFYTKELEFRRRMMYPPFYKLVRMEYRHLQAAKAEEVVRAMGVTLNHRIEQGKFSATDLIGPVPCFFARQNGYYRWQVIIRGPQPVEVLRGMTLPDWRIEVDPPSLL